MNFFSAEDEVPGEAVGVKSKRGRERQKKPVNEEEEEGGGEEREEEEEEGDDMSKPAPDEEFEISSSEEEEDSDTSTTDIEGEFPFNSNFSEKVRCYQTRILVLSHTSLTPELLLSFVTENWRGA